MFTCACSLRSTQCAALIALATAASIARIDFRAPKASITPASNGCQPASDVESREDPKLPAAVPVFALFVTQAWATGEGSSAGLERPSAPSADAFYGIRGERGPAGLALAMAEPNLGRRDRSLDSIAGEPKRVAFWAAQNRWPYPVGPPRHENHPPRPVLGTTVPGKPTACGTGTIPFP